MADSMPEDVYRAAAEAPAPEGDEPGIDSLEKERIWSAGYRAGRRACHRHEREAYEAGEAAGREAALADLRNRPACDCGHEFEPDPSWFHLSECSYRRGVASKDRGSADA